MDDFYKQYHKDALNLQYHFQDVVDDKQHPQMQALQHEVHQLVQDIEARRHPRSVEERLKTIEHELVQARSHGEQLMSYNDIDHLNHQYRRLRANIRSLPNY